MADIVTAEILATCMGTHILDSHLPGFLMGTYLTHCTREATLVAQ